MVEIRKFERIAHEKNWSVVAHQIPVPFFGVELRLP
jgi:hypothetical protein